MKKHFTPSFGLLLLRVAVGIIFIFHGYQKLAHIDQTVGFFAMLGLAKFFAYAVGAIELLGGIMLVLGVGACIVAPLLAGIMVFAVLLVKRNKGFQAMELDLMLLVANIAILSLGTGTYALKTGCVCGVCKTGDCCGKGTCGDCGSCNGCETCVCDAGATATGAKTCDCTSCKDTACDCSNKEGVCGCSCGNCSK